MCAFRQAAAQANAQVLEPVMSVQVCVSVNLGECMRVCVCVAASSGCCSDFGTCYDIHVCLNYLHTYIRAAPDAYRGVCKFIRTYIRTLAQSYL